MNKEPVGILGATSLVGSRLISGLVAKGCCVTAYSRRANTEHSVFVSWRVLAPEDERSLQPPIVYWICAAPIWVLPDYFSWLEKQGVKRIVAISSTSRFTKADSAAASEQQTVQRLANAEASLQAWAVEKGVFCVILRPTLIYGLGQDKNVVEIARFIRQYGFFPIFGQGRGLRQPIHTDDVAEACIAAMFATSMLNRSYNISGGETLTYRQMVQRIFETVGKSACFLSVPLWLSRIAVIFLRCIPRYRYLTPGVFSRMSQDLVFDHREASRDFGFAPRSFRLRREDVGG